MLTSLNVSVEARTNIPETVSIINYDINIRCWDGVSTKTFVIKKLPKDIEVFCKEKGLSAEMNLENKDYISPQGEMIYELVDPDLIEMLLSGDFDSTIYAESNDSVNQKSFILSFMVPYVIKILGNARNYPRFENRKADIDTKIQELNATLDKH